MPDLLFYWQPSRHVTKATRLTELESIERLAHLHVFQWQDGEEGGPPDRRALEEGESDWKTYLNHVADQPLPEGIPQRFAMLEFVRGDDVEQFKADAATLRRWLA